MVEPSTYSRSAVAMVSRIHGKCSARREWTTGNEPRRVRIYDAQVKPELAAAHAAVDEAVAILRDRRTRPRVRIAKAAKDFLTDVDLASESAMKRSLAASTPEIGFYGEEGGGPALDSGRIWVADPLDGTINYATGSPLCGVMLGLLEDGVPTLGVIDLPFLGVRVDSGTLADVGSLEEAIVGMGDAFHRGGARLDAYLELTMAVHRRALRFRCVGAASVLWTWLVSGQIQGMVLAHNNPYDVVAGHAIARAAGAICTDYAGAPLTLESSGAMAAVPGIQPELVSLAADLAVAARDGSCT
jgi:myo-inositol-1(or 4)-monophosphatase